MYLQLLSSTRNGNVNVAAAADAPIHEIVSLTSTVFSQSPGGRIGAGWALIVDGPVLLASEEVKPCFAVAYDRPGRDPQERVDYFTCSQCQLNWVCSSCASHCHRECREVRPFALKHLPSWGCCYCRKKARSRCKLATVDGTR